MTETNQRNRPRQTKIIVTLGPATDDPQVLRELIKAGIDAVRVNFSHGSTEDQLKRVRQLREIASEEHYHVGLIADLQGPKIRIGRFIHGQTQLRKGQRFTLSSHLDLDAGTDQKVGFTYKDLPKDIRVGDTLLLDDGRVDLVVEGNDNGEIVTRVQHDAMLSSSKGINRQGGGLSAPSISAKDREDIKTVAEMDADYLAVSFPKNAADVELSRELLKQAGSDAGVIAKIERAEALHHIDEIIEASDGIMIARGDLNLEIGDAELTAVQKRLIALARTRQKIAITATEMMQSMIDSMRPTRAEISDVANAVLDGTDAVMLSGETAIGEYPVVAVQTMSRICYGAEQAADWQTGFANVQNQLPERIDQAVAFAAIRTGKELSVRAIAALTESGSSALWMSRRDSTIPIYALTQHLKTCRKVTIYRGVYPGLLDGARDTHEQVNQQIISLLKRLKAIKDGDLLIVTKGDLVGIQGGTNAMKIIRVGEMSLGDE